MSWPELQQLMSQYEARAHQDMIGSPRVDLLLTLIQFNVFRALISNTSMLGLTVEEWTEDEDAVSPWNLKAYDNKQNFCPRSLRPTQIQRSVSHHPWIDLFPLPRMRDNLLRNSDSYDEWALCNDLVDFYEVPNEKTGLIVWNTPWDPSGWEASEEFLTKWKWVVEGCDELFTSTNYWRKQRGEEALNFY
ncbi:hypothetical protein N7490_005005 [Penicillium lividum]|nr:hypothetical protein N7490_005005 [Penicillium lividum]